MTVLAEANPDSLLDVLAARAEGLVHVERLPSRPARTVAVPGDLPGHVRAALPYDGLWSHQAEAIALARGGTDVAVATGTASGKSLCFQVPIAEAVTGPIRAGTALIVGPTKALAQDQLRAIVGLGVEGLVAATYDGDTPPESRTWVRDNANVVLTNPEMLHCGLLPHHDRWATFLHRLRFVVVDEMHTFRGVFGSHVAHVLRRLRRLCARYGSDPTFVFASATIGDPASLGSALCGKPVVAVDRDGSPRGERLVALWNPPVLDAPTGSRVSAHRITATLVADLVAAGHRTIGFCRSRRGTEIVASEARRRLGADADSVRPYRGGYLPAERRAIEAELFAGDLRGVVATSALELGVDVGGLDACVLDGFPGTVASMWQQMGRAGRTQRRSLAVLVAGEDALDQYLMAHPTEVFTRPLEPAVINPSNPFVLDAHLACAAYETPLTRADERWWGDDLDDGVRRLVGDDRLKVRAAEALRTVTGPGGRADRCSGGFETTAGSEPDPASSPPALDSLRTCGQDPGRSAEPPGPRAVWAGGGYPSHGVGLRSGGGEEVQIVRADGTTVGTVDAGRAPEVVHPGAVYLHQGSSWRVDSFDGDAAWVHPDDGTEVTQARSTVQIRVLSTDESRPVGRATLSIGAVEVTSQVIGYQRRDATNGEILGHVDLEMEPSSLVTRAFWYAVPTGLLRRSGLTPARWPGTLHAAEHTAIGMLPLFAICDRWDVGGVSTPWSAELSSPAIFVYDGYPGGAGIAELGYQASDRHLIATRDTLRRCPCDDGCPSCVQSPKCGNLNEPLDKSGALALLDALRLEVAGPTALAG